MNLNLNIKQRTIGVFSIISFLVIILALIGYLTSFEIQSYNDFRSSFDKLQINLNKAKNKEKEFVEFDTKNDAILKGDLESVNLKHVFDNNLYSRLVLDSIRNNEIAEDFGIYPTIDSLNMDYIHYDDHMKSLFEAYKEKGFTKSGLEGDLRKIIHEVEDIEKKEIIPYVSGFDRGYLLMLRRKEKDFFLRKKEKYHKSFLEKVEVYKDYLNEISSNPSLDSSATNFIPSVKLMLDKVDEYAKSFTKNVEINKTIGFKSTLGINKDLNATYTNMSNRLDYLVKRVRILSNKSISSWNTMFWSFTIILLMIIFALSAIYLRTLLIPLKTIQTSLDQLSTGEKNNVISTGKELLDVALNLDDLKERINTAAEFSTQIGSGNLDLEYNPKYDNDMLAKSVIEMREKLRDNKEVERVRVWKTEGIAKFSSILQEEKDNVSQLSVALVSHLCRYLNANQAGIFVKNDDDPNNPVLELSGSYAYERSKFLKKSVLKGEDLVGQCWVEGQKIYLTDIPENYITVTSGLGDANPSCLIILPLIYNDEVMGVLEMASFNVFQEHEIEFLEQLSGNIASTLSGTKIASKTKYLLEESKMMQESLQAQEEEMRQNMEEMQATQDMMTEKENDYLGRINKLEKTIRRLKA